MLQFYNKNSLLLSYIYESIIIEQFVNLFISVFFFGRLRDLNKYNLP